ncbi:arylsulfotransferase [Kipferlia bialata]|uniref:Arylsulfotransferase n=1 Tax=Kipferlia bialata TaxID=797122 RepID=A0A9K3D259_9EUKA|nr:arylsulfotransferase [Kipferlia bialata]|eukprot:g8769.t1
MPVALSALYLDASGDISDDFCMRVQYRRVAQAGDLPDVWHYATCNEIRPGMPTYMTVVGMQAETEYQLRHDYVRVPRPQPHDAVQGMRDGEAVTFTTGAIPKAVQKRVSPYVMRPQHIEAPNSPVSEHEGYMLQSTLKKGKKPGLPTATDMNGNIVYYLPYYKGAYQFGSDDTGSGSLTRVSGKGTWFLNGSGKNTLNPGMSTQILSQVWAEIDLEGVPLWTLSIYQVNDMLLEGGHELIAEILGHHDAIRTPDGRTLLLGAYSSVDFDLEPEVYKLRDFPECNEERKGPTPTERAEEVAEQHWDFVLEFDADRTLTKSWKAKDHIYQTLAEQNEESYNSIMFDLPALALEPMYYSDSAMDRTHCNTLHMDPSDGGVFLSARHYDAVFKLDWENDGEPLFNIQELALYDADYQPYVKDFDNNIGFFSHQHCIETYQVEGRDDVKLVSLFDNNNTLVIKHGQPAHSNGVLALVHEARREAVILMRKPLPTFCAALGTSQVLANGNTWYHCGTHTGEGLSGKVGSSSTVYEINTDGDIVYSAGCDAASYRVWRLHSLYGGTDYTPVAGTESLPIPEAWDV